MFFSEEKNQKTFMSFGCRCLSSPCLDAGAAVESKSFLVLFFKKELLSS